MTKNHSPINLLYRPLQSNNRADKSKMIYSPSSDLFCQHLNGNTGADKPKHHVPTNIPIRPLPMAPNPCQHTPMPFNPCNHMPMPSDQCQHMQMLPDPCQPKSIPSNQCQHMPMHTDPCQPRQTACNYCLTLQMLSNPCQPMKMPLDPCQLMPTSANPCRSLATPANPCPPQPNFASQQFDPCNVNHLRALEPLMMVDFNVNLSAVSEQLTDCKLRYRREIWRIICDTAVSDLGGTEEDAGRRTIEAKPDANPWQLNKPDSKPRPPTEQPEYSEYRKPRQPTYSWRQPEKESPSERRQSFKPEPTQRRQSDQLMNLESRQTMKLEPKPFVKMDTTDTLTSDSEESKNQVKPMPRTSMKALTIDWKSKLEAKRQNDDQSYERDQQSNEEEVEEEDEATARNDNVANAANNLKWHTYGPYVNSPHANSPGWRAKSQARDGNHDRDQDTKTSIPFHAWPVWSKSQIIAHQPYTRMCIARVRRRPRAILIPLHMRKKGAASCDDTSCLTCHCEELRVPSHASYPRRPLKYPAREQHRQALLLT